MVLATCLKTLYKEQFEIIQSTTDDDIKSANLLPSMVAICNDCLSKFFSLTKYEKHDHYFVTTDTNRSSKYSILQTVPYDRDSSTPQLSNQLKTSLKARFQQSEARF